GGTPGRAGGDPGRRGGLPLAGGTAGAGGAAPAGRGRGRRRGGLRGQEREPGRPVHADLRAPDFVTSSPGVAPPGLGVGTPCASTSGTTRWWSAPCASATGAAASRR